MRRRETAPRGGVRILPGSGAGGPSAAPPIVFIGTTPENTMFDTPVRDVMQQQKLLKAAPEMLVSDAAKLMATKKAGAIIVVVDGGLVGIFTERDIVCRVVARGLDARATHIADVMTPEPQTIAPDQPFGSALLIMHEHSFRHLPVVENGKPIGIVSARSAMDPDLEEFVSEAQRRRHYQRKK
jgi:CBS domain-containing protein